MHTSVYQKVVAFDFMFPPLLLLLEITNTFLLAKRKLTKNFGLTLTYTLPGGFAVQLAELFVGVGL